MEPGVVACPRGQWPVVGQPDLIPVTRIGESVQKIRRTEAGRICLRYCGDVETQRVKVLRKDKGHLLVVGRLPRCRWKCGVCAESRVETGQDPQNVSRVVV